jgi:lipopolysaccharide/colanic/teichoic acid biosynthesis glycosyltransferase
VSGEPGGSALDAFVAVSAAIAVPASRPQASAPPAQPAIRRERPAWEICKRLLDVALAVAFLAAMLPILVLIAVLVRLDSPGPVLFRQVRFGRDRRPFVVLKFRTMTDGASSDAHREYIAGLARANADQGGLKKLTHDPRVTRVGSFLRSSSLDELPQLLNVVTGDMSVIGPRPAIDYELEHYEPSDFARFDVRPGLTGLWQVSGRSELGFREMLALDAEYARTTGPLVDARILARTPLELLRRRAS